VYNALMQVIAMWKLSA